MIAALLLIALAAIACLIHRPKRMIAALLVALPLCLGCDVGAKAEIPNMDAAALEIVTEATILHRAEPTPAEPAFELELVPLPEPAKPQEKPAEQTSAHFCPCGPDCRCDNCPEDCQVTLASAHTAAEIVPAFLPVRHVAAQTADELPSRDEVETCARGKCGPAKTCTPSECTAERCASDTETHHAGSCCGAGDREFMERGPVRRFVKNVKPVRRAGAAVLRFLFRRGACCR